MPTPCAASPIALVQLGAVARVHDRPESRALVLSDVGERGELAGLADGAFHHHAVELDEVPLIPTAADNERVLAGAALIRTLPLPVRHGFGPRENRGFATDRAVAIDYL